MSPDTYITANTQASVRLPWLQLRLLSPTKSNKILQTKKWHQRFVQYTGILYLGFSKVAGR